MKTPNFCSYFRFPVVISLALAATFVTAPAQTGISPQSVSVRLKYFTSNKDRDYPLANETIQLLFDGKTFEGKTNRLGILQFRRVPCDTELTVWVRGTPQANFKRWISCGKSANWIYFFDSYASPEGKIIQQR